MKKLAFLLVILATLSVALLVAPVAAQVMDTPDDTSGVCVGQVGEQPSYDDGGVTYVPAPAQPSRSSANVTVNNPTKIIYQTRIVRGRTVRVPARTIVRDRTVQLPAARPVVINNFNTPAADKQAKVAVAAGTTSPWAWVWWVIGAIILMAVLARIFGGHNDNGGADAAANRIGIQRAHTGEADPPAPAGESEGWAKQVHYDHAGRIIYVRRDKWPVTVPGAPAQPQPAGIANPAAILSPEGLQQLLDLQIEVQPNP